MLAVLLLQGDLMVQTQTETQLIEELPLRAHKLKRVCEGHPNDFWKLLMQALLKIIYLTLIFVIKYTFKEILQHFE